MNKTIILLIVAFVVYATTEFLIQNAKISKLNDRIERVYEVVEYNNETINYKFNEIEESIWKLENPAKYSVGDRVGDYVVVSVETHRGVWNSYEASPDYDKWSCPSWTYYIVDINTGKSHWRKNPEVDPMAIYFIDTD